MPERDAARWLTNEQAAAICGYTPAGFRVGVRQHLAREAFLRDGRRVLVDGKKLLEFLVARETARFRAAGGVVNPGEEGMITGPGSRSPSLERWRKEKADAAEMENEIQRGLYEKRESILRREVEMVLQVKQALLGMGPKLAPRLANVDAKDAARIIGAEALEIAKAFAEGMNGEPDAKA